MKTFLATLALATIALPSSFAYADEGDELGGVMKNRPDEVHCSGSDGSKETKKKKAKIKTNSSNYSYLTNNDIL